MIPIENHQQVSVLVTSSISIFMVIAAVGLRLVAKRMSNRVDYSDYCIVAAALCNTALHACCMLLVTYGGFGFHTTDIYKRFGPDTAIFFFKGIMTFSILWNATVCFSKLSVLSMYTALIPMDSMWQWARLLGAVIITWNVSDIIAALLICQPLAKNWNFEMPGTCGNRPSFYFAMGVINLITDAVIILLPMPYLYKLRLAWRRKLAAMALLSIGVGTWAITIYRQTLLPTLDFADMTHAGVLATLLSGLEPAVAIVLACIPLMRRLFTKSKSAKGSSFEYSASRQTTLFSKKGSRLHDDPTVTFSELSDNNDASSEIELQPVKTSQVVRVSSVYKHDRELVAGNVDHAITVEKMWEVRRD